MMTEDAAREMFEQWRWPDGPRCPRCGRGNPATTMKRGHHRYRCRGPCYFIYYVWTGTVMERTRLPFTMWAEAFTLLNRNPGMSVHRLRQKMGLHHTTAYHLYSAIMSTLRSKRTA